MEVISEKGIPRGETYYFGYCNDLENIQGISIYAFKRKVENGYVFVVKMNKNPDFNELTVNIQLFP